MSKFWLMKLKFCFLKQSLSNLPLRLAYLTLPGGSIRRWKQIQYIIHVSHRSNELLMKKQITMIAFHFPGYNVVQNWVVDNHWDAEITQSALDILTKISNQRRIYLIILISYCGMHVLNSLFLIAGVLCQKRLLLLPWLIQVDIHLF